MKSLKLIGILLTAAILGEITSVEAEAWSTDGSDFTYEGARSSSRESLRAHGT